MKTSELKIAYSGHETFVCRYAWLPKAIQEVGRDPGVFKDDSEAMVRLGVGKNMVRSVRFWAQAAQIIESSSEGYSVTPFGERLLGREGHDTYLERPETLWLIHWKLATNPNRQLFHWHQMLNYWHRSEFSESEVIPFLKRGLRDPKDCKSDRTLADGFRVFVNSYAPSRGKKGEIAEDNLDCPLVELGLLRLAGQHTASDQTREPIYSFNIGAKPSITSALLAYCVDDYWRNSPHQASDSLGFRFISSAEGSPGQIFKLPEAVVKDLLEGLGLATNGLLSFEESQSMQQVMRKRDADSDDLLDAIYSI